jgi:carboxylate-amine ligase
VARGTLGVEEEYQLIDAETGELRPVNDIVLDAAAPALGENVHPELLRCQVEVSTPVCSSLGELDASLRQLRRRLNQAAERYGCRLGAAGTHPTADWQRQEVTPSERYLEMAGEFQQIALETLICGCHVHVGIDDADERITVMNRIRPWLPTLLALSTNSPFWAGRDTGYASYRTMVFRRWPTTGMPSYFADAAEYELVLAAMVDAEIVEDATHLYWDVRPSARFPTLEVRIADVCLTVDEAVTLAGLVRAMAATASFVEPSDREVRGEVLEGAVWRAARHGLSERLVDLSVGRLRRADDAVDRLLGTLRPALEEAGDWNRVADGVKEIVAGGSGAARQRAVYRRTGSLRAVTDYITERTASGTAASS